MTTRDGGAAALFATWVIAASSVAGAMQSTATRAAPRGTATTAPDAAATAVVAANSALAAGDLDRAATLAAGHLRQHPHSAAARVVVARVHIARDELDAAWQELNHAAAEQPRDVDVLYYLGQVSGQLAARQFERLEPSAALRAREVALHDARADGLALADPERRRDADEVAIERAHQLLGRGEVDQEATAVDAGVDDERTRTVRGQ